MLVDVGLALCEASFEFHPARRAVPINVHPGVVHKEDASRRAATVAGLGPRDADVSDITEFILAVESEDRVLDLGNGRVAARFLGTLPGDWACRADDEPVRFVVSDNASETEFRLELFYLLKYKTHRAIVLFDFVEVTEGIEDDDVVCFGVFGLGFVD